MVIFQEMLLSIQLKGALFESDYPYTASIKKCQKAIGTAKANGRKTWSTVFQAYGAIAQYPIPVSVHTSNWKGYTEGIFYGCVNNTSINHAVVAVGYDIKGSCQSEILGKQLSSRNTCGVLRRLDLVI